MRTIETDVLIIGGGVVGLTASMLLTRLGVDNRLYTYYAGTSPQPKAHILNQRSMEIFDELGLADKIYAVSTPSGKMRYAGWFAGIKGNHPCAGREIGRVEAWGVGYEDPDYVAASPCPPGNYPQMYLEPIIRDHAEAMSPGRVTYFHELLDFDQDRDAVTARIRDRETDEVFCVRARFMIAADGGKTVGPQLGIKMEGKPPFMRMASVHFKADFSQITTGADMLTRFLINPDIGGSWASGVLLPEGPLRWGHHAEEWLFHTKNPDQSEAPQDKQAVIDWMFKVLGLETDEVEEIIHVSEWYMQGIIAERYREGRILLAGDACKVHPPTGGLGMNSGVQDAYNLGWKLKLVLEGIADPAFLDTYETERRPVAERNVAAALANAAEHFHIDRALGLDDANDAETNWANMARLWDDDPSHDKLRQDVYQAVQRNRIGLRHHNIEFGATYPEGAVVPDGDPPHEPLDPIRIYEPSTRPGHPVPHAWISRTGDKIALGQMVADGNFVLVAGENGYGWIDAAHEIAAQTGLPIRSFTLGFDEGDYLDIRGTWLRLRRMDDTGAVLIRPDRYIGFHSPTGASDPGAVLRAALAKVAGLRCS